MEQEGKVPTGYMLKIRNQELQEDKAPRENNKGTKIPKNKIK
jgi:hypothetical protein